MSNRNYERAQNALAELKAAVVAEIESSERGMTHAALVKSLGLESSYEGKNRNYLSWSILGLLLSEKRVRYRGHGQGKTYLAREDQ